ncbi:MAG: DNA mismatch repair endonuclease MutL [candidate division WOR-3 bacterium]|nr:DNA mismatch repair endonuclease MutL [candidate division WOR-3 bacterium]MDW8114152.1 DNA mismatch repair endonuclease MutL [candidate division WOR-3 bacterium]
MVEKLKEEVIKKIACGEVIFRPASCVKELIENSLDANSEKIIIELKEGGKRLIKVIDDGYGMDKKDLFLAIERYSTSKLKTIEDLKKIKTYGFRGEALSAIASCSLLRIESSTKDGEGYYIEVKDNKIVDSGLIIRKRGTTVYVRDLFYNYPVRRNFLKSSYQEFRLILEVVKNYLLSNYSVSFQLKNDEKNIFNYPKANSIKERLEMVLGKETFSSLLEIYLENPHLTVYGFISDPERIFLPAEIQAIFFNKRPVKSLVTKRAIYDGYGGTLLGKNPNFIIFIETPPEYLDVNIHPTKEEVRFIDEKFLYDFICQGIREKLKIEKDLEYFELSEEIKDLEEKKEPLLIEEKKLFWQLHNKYIFTQIKSGFCIVDQHAASERILFEKLLKSESLEKISQPLLFPILIELKPEVFSVIQELKEELNYLGLEIEIFGENTIAIKAIPIDTFFSKEDLKELILEIYNNYKEIEKKPYEKRRELYVQLIACKGAIKANQRLNEREMESLINQLFSCSNPYFCPHGRPTIIKFEISEIDKKFGR